jgi:hypothetical protein
MTIRISGRQAAILVVGVVAAVALSVAIGPALNPAAADAGSSSNSQVVTQLKKVNLNLKTLNGSVSKLNGYIGSSVYTPSSLRGESKKYAGALYDAINKTCRALASSPYNCPSYSGQP